MVGPVSRHGNVALSFSRTNSGIALFYLEIWILNVFPRGNALHFAGHDNIFKAKKIYAFI